MGLAPHRAGRLWEPAVTVGSRVTAGDLLGTVSDILGDSIVEVRAPADGVPLFITSSPAVGDDGLLMGLARSADRPAPDLH